MFTNRICLWGNNKKVPVYKNRADSWISWANSSFLWHCVVYWLPALADNSQVQSHHGMLTGDQCTRVALFCVHMIKETFKVKSIFHTERVNDDWVSQILCVNQKVSLLEDLIDFDFKSYIKNKKFTIFLAFQNNLCYYRVKKMSNLILNGL